MRRSEVLAEESMVCLQKALTHLREIWELIGIPEEQRLQRTEVVKNHIKDLLDRMIAEEESLRERLLKSISSCQKELSTRCSELQVKPFQGEGETTVLQLERDLRSQIDSMRKQKRKEIKNLSYFRNKIKNCVEVFACPTMTLTAPLLPP